jgi:hypothetical protein
MEIYRLVDKSVKRSGVITNIQYNRNAMIHLILARSQVATRFPMIARTVHIYRVDTNEQCPSCHESFCANYISHHPQTIRTLCSIIHPRLFDSTLSNWAYLSHPFFIIEAANIAEHAFHTTFKDLLVNRKDSDLVITCHSNPYNVQKAIVCSRSGFFERADKFPGKEHEEDEVDLHEYDPRAVKAIVQYL